MVSGFIAHLQAKVAPTSVTHADRPSHKSGWFAPVGGEGSVQFESTRLRPEASEWPNHGAANGHLCAEDQVAREPDCAGPMHSRCWNRRSPDTEPWRAGKPCARIRRSVAFSDNPQSPGPHRAAAAGDPSACPFRAPTLPRIASRYPPNQVLPPHRPAAPDEPKAKGW